jgi:hypothetical protein
MKKTTAATITAVTLAALAFASAAPAHADANTANYLRAMRALGVSASDGTDQTMLKNGQAQCQELAAGETVAQVATEAFDLSRRAYSAGQLGPGQVPLTFAQAVEQVNLAHTYLCPNASQMPATLPMPITETVTVTPRPVTVTATPAPVTVTATPAPVTITATAQPTTVTAAPLTATVTRPVFEAVAPTARESDNGGVWAPMLGVVLALVGCTALGFVGAALWRLRPRPEHATAGGFDDASPTWSWVHTEDYDDPAQPETMADPDAETVTPNS